MSEQEHGPIRLGFWAVLLFSVFAWAPTTYPGYWQSLEGFRPVFNAAQSSVIASVATDADLWRGAGSAAYLITQPLMILGLAPVAAVRITFGIAIVLGGLGIYPWLRSRWGDRAAGLAGVLYMLWPPLLATVYVRGSLADVMILALLPLALAGVAIYAQQRSPSAVAVIAVSVLWMWRSQAGLAAAASVLLLLYALLAERSRITALIVGLSAAAGFTSLIPHWSIRADSPVVFFEHFVYPHQLLFGTWQVAPSEPGWQDGYPFMLGLAVTVFSLVALWLWLTQWRKWSGSAESRVFVFSALGALVLILLSLPVSKLLWSISGADRLFTYPWQVLLLAGPLLVLVAGSLPFSLSDLGRPVLWTLLICLTVFGSLPYLITEFTQIQPPEKPLSIFGEAQEIVLIDAGLSEDIDSQTAELAITWQTLNTPTFDYNVFFQAIRQTDDGHSVVAQLDVQPLQGLHPATLWSPGDIYTDTYTLDLSDLDPNSDVPLRYYFGYYDWRDGSRLPVDGGIDDKMVFYGQ